MSGAVQRALAFHDDQARALDAAILEEQERYLPRFWFQVSIADAEDLLAGRVPDSLKGAAGLALSPLADLLANQQKPLQPEAR